MIALVRFVQLGDGARASARFNVREEEALETPSLLVFFELKRRERRAPLPPYSCHSNSRTSITTSAGSAAIHGQKTPYQLSVTQ